MGIMMTIKDTDAVTLAELLAQLPNSVAVKEVALLKKHGDAWEKVAKDFSAEVERLKSTLKEVSGCHEKHNTPKLCDGCLISIFDALNEDKPDNQSPFNGPVADPPCFIGRCPATGYMTEVD